MPNDYKYRIFFKNGTEIDVSDEEGEAIRYGLESPDVHFFEITMRKKSNGILYRKFSRDALEAIEYTENYENFQEEIGE